MQQSRYSVGPEIFTHNVAWLRRHHGLSKREMAKRLHISPKTLDKLEAGEVPQKLSAKILLHIWNSFGVSLEDQLRGRLDESKREKKEQ